jgi:Fur family ferric uptake transcriptional regulator
MLPAETRLTPARRAILAAVEGRRNAFTVEEIQHVAGTSPATTYRTIELLRRAGSIHALPGAHYVRCATRHHHHLVCTACGSVEDTELCAAPPDEELRRRHGFRAATHEVDIYGLCRRCA